MSNDVTIETFAADNPDIYQQAFDRGKADGEKNERDIFEELAVACADDLELLIQCYKEGKTAEEALHMRTEKLTKTNVELSAKITELQTAGGENKDEKLKVDPAKTEFSDGAEKATTVKTDATDDESLKQKFAESAELQKEFMNVEGYIAYVKHEQKK